MMEFKRFKPQKCSPEVLDIIERMPATFGRRVAVCMVVFAAIALFFGWILKYPDTVSGTINISSDVPPVRLTANSSGTLSLIKCDVCGIVHEDEYIGIIQNSAIYEDVVKVKRLLDSFDPNDGDYVSGESKFPDKVFMGELDMKYYSFLTSLKNMADYCRGNVFDRQRISIMDNIRGIDTVCQHTELALDIICQRLSILRKWNDKYRSIDKENVPTYEYELDRNKNDILSIQQEEAVMHKDLASLRMQITENRNMLAKLDIERQEKERQLHMDVITSYHDLCDNIRAWEQRYVLKAPCEGRLELLKFITNNQYVQTGEELFGVIPQNSKLVGKMVLPSSGAGKIRIGSRVTIKLDDYPYMEYGSVDGVVKNISQLAHTLQSEKSQVTTYMVIVELPDVLSTNYGRILDFKPEMSGVADIVVNERRLIERLFDNLKYRTR